jgi:hypothetical protein
MIKHAKYSIVGMLAALSCGNEGVDPPEESNDFDAIYNIIRFDTVNEFNLNLQDFSLPDTTGFFTGPYTPVRFWRQLNHDSLFINIEINDPEPGDTIGSVRWANVHVIKYFYGSFELMAVDSAGDDVRLSKPFAIPGSINAVFQKVGFDHNSRRGWVLSRVGDGGFNQNGPAIREFSYWAVDDPGHIYHSAALRDLGDIPEFSPGDSISARLTTVLPGHFVSARFRTVSGLVTREAIVESDTSFSTGFVVSPFQGFDRFLVEIFAAGTVSDTIRYESMGMAPIYRVR